MHSTFTLVHSSIQIESVWERSRRFCALKKKKEEEKKDHKNKWHYYTLYE